MSSGPLPPDLAQFLRDELGDAPAAVSFEREVSGPVLIWTGAAEGEPAKGSWYFLSVTGPDAEAIRGASAGRTGGWGSVKVEIEYGRSRWVTSLFPTKGNQGFFLPLKAAVRKKEAIGEGDHIAVMLRLV